MSWVGVAATLYVVCIHTDKVAQAVRRERLAEVGCEHLLDVAYYQSRSREVCQCDSPHEPVHVTPRNAWLHHRQDLALRVEHGIIHHTLIR